MNRFVRLLEKTQIFVGVAFLCVFIVTILIQITTRHLEIAVIWTEEVATHSFIWSVFMGAAVMVNRREHFSFDYLTKKLKGRKQATLNIIIDITLIAFNVLIFNYGIKVVEQFWNYNWVSMPDLKMGYVWIAIPIMAGTMIIYSLSHLVKHVQVLRSGEVQ
ncbi:TRAP transporter small permease [Tenuibacillus multivorans]|uniref:TRAP-type C4-dicarboxylate transport system, small permease component n=1 Tax=Tenuibacillus multivorans TaxID=237069 RepID=A0A1H0C217_9BACI|nr:TRAP transporter small permease [Tenuibacillus multivorans]GEL77736.1 hypothetical protein TMU01_19710 [Tenuibacillus multivorans]SDN51921.1 TRAP-type C4-dicarboxylate transport system, small permease component [Tenuibacillus multivorans]